ncbi:helix-turn-helix domain-containing protein [Nostoc sp.]|uniref:helix-turn-helix domain-containing protein n=1 Tax=Nostoc sp. TaxID=1180 RepID=UPI002FF90985
MNSPQFNEALEMLKKAPCKVEVLKLLLAGYTNDEIAQSRGRAEGTVRKQISNVYKDFGIKSEFPGDHALRDKLKALFLKLKKVAANRDMTLEALLKFYIGQSLRQDLAKFFSERVLESTAEVLARHIESKEEILTIIQEIQAEATL